MRADEARGEPQDVAHTWSSVLSFVWKVTSNAFAKFWPRKWDVPACSDFLSCIMASMQYVRTAPANFSESVFTPCRTGTAMYSSANVS